MRTAPKWYRDLYKKFIEENPTKNDESQMKTINDIDNIVATKGPIPSWDTSTDHLCLKSDAYENLNR